jgi:hypothetical protein
MNKPYQQFVESSEHLPAPIQDFHDAKDVFKTMWAQFSLEKFPPAIKNFGWINCQILVIDIFLWWMAKRGWTLQRSRAKVNFLDLDKDIEEYQRKEDEETRNFFRRP